ncbi:MAG: TolC family protein [Balneolaceae bacterium]
MNRIYRLPIALSVIILIVLSGWADPSAARQLDGVSERPSELEILYTYYGIALDQNPELASLKREAEAMSERSRQVKVLPDPQIRTSYFLNPVNDADFLDRFSVGISQAFPWFGTLSKRSQIEDDRSRALLYGVSARQLEIFTEIQDLWFQYFTLEHHAHITGGILQLIRDLEPIIEARYQTAGSSQVDLLRLQMEEQRLMERMEAFEDNKKPIQARFNELLNRDFDAEIVVPMDLPQRELAFTREELLRMALDYHPGFDRLEAQKSEFRHRMDLARLEGRPSFVLGFDVQGRQHGMLNLMMERNEILTTTATIRVPLFRSRYNAQRQEAQLQLQRVQLQEEGLTNTMQTRIEQSYIDLIDAQRKHRLITEELVPRMEHAFALITEEYRNGTARFDEVLQISRELLMLEMERVEKLTAQNSAMAALEQITATD